MKWNIISILSVILGLLFFLVQFSPFYAYEILWALPILAVVFGIISLIKSNKLKFKFLGILGIILGFLNIFIFFSFLFFQANDKIDMDFNYNTYIASNYNSYGEGSKVTIITEKEEYKIGEEISFRAEIDGDVYAWLGEGWSIYKKNSDKWIKIVGDNYCLSSCDGVNLSGVGPCSIISCERPFWYKANNSEWQWNRKYPSEIKRSRCISTDFPDIVSHECVIYGQITPGEYKVRFEYRIDEPTLDKVFDRKGANIYYNEKKFIVL